MEEKRAAVKQRKLSWSAAAESMKLNQIIKHVWTAASNRMQITHLYIWLPKLIRNVGKGNHQSWWWGDQLYIPLGTQVGVEGRKENYLLLESFVPSKASSGCKEELEGITWEAKCDSKVWYRWRKFSFLQFIKPPKDSAVPAGQGKGRATPNSPLL